MYKLMRITLTMAVPVAVGALFYLASGMGVLSLMLGVIACIAVLEEVPEPKDVRRILRNNMPASGNIWYMIESRDTGEIRVYK
jgi:hypothetical protein